MSRVLVTGGTGRLGRVLLPRLAEAGHEVRAIIRRAGAALPPGVEGVAGDLSDTHAFLPRILEGVQHLVHLASGAADGAIDGVDLAGTRLLIERAKAASAPHLLYLSIVGIDRVDYPLYRAKVEIERLIAESGLPWTVLRTTQFHELIRDWLRMPPGRHFPARMRYQPIAAVDVADAVLELIEAGPRNAIVEMGGPEVLDARDLARTFADVTGEEPPDLPPLAPGVPEDGLLAPGHHEGHLTWRAFLEQSRADQQRRDTTP